jgi:hypothetical protein
MSRCDRERQCRHPGDGTHGSLGWLADAGGCSVQRGAWLAGWLGGDVRDQPSKGGERMLVGDSAAAVYSTIV